jgi:hypothetical protein
MNDGNAEQVDCFTLLARTGEMRVAALAFFFSLSLITAL